MHKIWPLEKQIYLTGDKSIEFCAMSKPICSYRFVKNGVCIRLFSWGEEIKDLTLDDWTYDFKE